LVIGKYGAKSMEESVTPSTKPCTDSSQRAAGQRTTTMRSRDKYDPPHLRYWLVAVRPLEETAILKRSIELIKGNGAARLPEPRTAALDHHLRQYAAQAVTDDDHLIECGIRTARVEEPPSPQQGLSQ